MAITSVPVRVNKDLRPSWLFKNISSYLFRSLKTIVRIFVVCKPFRFFMTLSLGSTYSANGFNAPYITALSTRNYYSFRRISIFHLTGSILTVLILFFGADKLSMIFGNERLGILFKFAALDIIPFCWFQRNLVFLNVHGKYWSFFFSLSVYSTFKAFFMISEVLIFASVEAAILGMVLGSVMATLFSWVMTVRSSKNPLPIKPAKIIIIQEQFLGRA